MTETKDTLALHRLRIITDGIDSDECTREEGWWETSSGAEFGRQKLAELENLVMCLEAERDAAQEVAAMNARSGASWAARVQELESQLEAIGAGGVEPLRRRECLHQIAEPADLWTIRTEANEGESPWCGLYALRADSERDAVAMNKITGRHWELVPLVVATQTAPAAGDWINVREVQSLVRELDVALNGEHGAAPQASLCDVVGQVKAEADKLGRPVLAAPAAVAGPSADVQAKIDSNIWDDFGDILPTLKAISRGDWFWGANSRCKYIEIRLDTRDGGCVLYDRDRVRISPEQFAFQAAGCLGKMDPWPAKNALAAPATQAVPAAQGDALDAAFEAAVRHRLCGLQRYSFALDDDGVVRRVEDRTGRWIEFDDAHELFDPVAVDAARSQAKEGGA